MDSGILIDSMSGEQEILEFTLNGNAYGINVAIIREIINYQEVTPVPNSHPSIEGVMMPRDVMITAIDLKNCLQKGSSEPSGLFIITRFSDVEVAFHVDAVVGIHRVSTKDIIKPNATVSGTEEGVSRGIIKKDDRLIIVLDFDRIIMDISPELNIPMADVI